MQTLTDYQKVELVEKYLAKTLTIQEEQAFQMLLQQKNDFAQAVLFQQDLMLGVAVQGRKSLKQQFEALEEKIQGSTVLEDAPSNLFQRMGENILEEIQQLGYSLEEFIDLFRPVGNYHTAIAATTRSKDVNFLLSHPENGADIREGMIEFDFGEHSLEEVEIIVEDNQHGALIEIELEGSDSPVRLLLSPENFKAGRYYWKIILEDELVRMGYFYVRRDLMEMCGQVVNFEL